ncbi:MAG: 23S rRNA (pseudouridine(1915)-N(3))-methyltransferase RlmH [Muribaculaceae bacterium]|nr:23S rRNA (pseudouridine(1915)-N(3))-methyltransferase RlmH [Muribaculaceae bacterium]
MGTVRDGVVSKAIETYSKRISHYWPFEIECLPDVKSARSAGPERQKELEGERFLSAVSPGDFLVLLDERGKEMTSREFSAYIERKSVELPRCLVFIVGGPYGFSRTVYERADAMLSLSKMTFPHELVRLFMVEQLYRAGTISRGEPYHHD